MIVVLSAGILAAAIVWGAYTLAAELKSVRADIRQSRTLALIDIFSPAVASAPADPHVLLAWQPLVRAARGVCPQEFAALDQASGGGFPFSAKHIETAHAQWTADWLAWERTHDAQYKLRAMEAEHNAAGDADAVVRARLDTVEREKLEVYQRRYEEYIRIAKGLQALSAP
jgi:hypothetical protein